MDYRKYSVTINGETPLLMHQDNLQWVDFVKSWQNDPANKKTSVAGDDRSPAWTWIGYLYTEHNNVVIPSDNIMTVLREGGAKVPNGSRGSFKRQTQSSIIVDQSSWNLLINNKPVSYDPIKKLIGEKDFQKHEDVVNGLGFSLFVKRAKIGSNKHVRVRPRFDRWSASGTITVLDETINTPTITNILKYGGAYAGLCDWRPSSKTSPGSFGRFSVEVKEVTV